MSLFHGSLFDFIAHPEWMQTSQVQAAVWGVAESMAAEVAKVNASSWRAAAYKSSNARKIYEALQEEIEHYGLRPILNQIARENANLITSLPLYVSRRLTTKAAELQREGKRPAELERELRKIAPHLANSRIEMIARTSISGAETDMTRARAERIGVEWGVWETSNDQRVRPSHKIMDGVLVRWNDPPSPEALIGQKSTLGRYLAGKCPNCRCAMLPLISLDEVKWPHKIYIWDSIRVMTRAQFTKAVGMPLAA
jgi:SPP1 gp7 family putative phage head morphogenesis protein